MSIDASKIRLEMAGNFPRVTELMWNVAGKQIVKASQKGKIPGWDIFGKGVVDSPDANIVTLIETASDVRFNLYRKESPDGFIAGDIIMKNIPNIEDPLNRGKVVVKIQKEEDLTWYYKLTVIENGEESELDDSFVRTILSAEETMTEADFQSVKGLNRAYTITVPAETSFDDPVIVDFIRDLGSYVRSLYFINNGPGDIEYVLNNKNNVSKKLEDDQWFNFDKDQSLIFRLLFANDTEKDAEIEIVASI